MAEKFPLDAAQIVALFMESVFYGYAHSEQWCCGFPADLVLQ